MKPGVLLVLETANVSASTYFRAWCMVRARQAAAGCCCSHPGCPRAARLALWLERRAVPWQA